MLQRLSPQQIQGIKLLELPTLQLEARIKQEIESNPVLEQDETIDSSDGAESGDGSAERGNNSLEEYIRSEESASSYKLKVNNSSKDDEHRGPTLSQGKSLSEFLEEQLAYYSLSEVEQVVAYFIVGTLDADGYLRRSTESLIDDIAFTQGVEVSADTVDVRWQHFV